MNAWTAKKPSESSPKTAAATCAMTVRWEYPSGAPTSCDASCATWTSEMRANAVMPTNITMVSPPMIASVAAALRARGCRKLGTPLLTASTPVRAVHPDEKARRTRTTTRRPVTSPVGRTPMSADSARGASPTSVATTPTTIIAKTQTMNP